MLSWEYPPHVVGGLGQHVSELVPSLAAQGVELHLLTPRWKGGEARESFDGGRIYRLDPPSGPFSDYHDTAVKANRILEDYAARLWEREKDFDLVHAHDWLVGFAACGLKRRFRVPIVSTIHATELGRSGGELKIPMQYAIHDMEWWLTYESQKIICASGFMAQEVKRHFQVPEVTVIPNGVRAERFKALEEQDLVEFRNRFALPHEPLVLFVGRLVQEKGGQVLVEAAPRVLAQHPKAKFVVAGTGSMAEDLKKRAAQLETVERFVFPGFIPDKDRDRLYKAADVAVFPSLYEPFGIVALEAMAAGTPVVVSQVGGLAEVVQHAETGILTYPGDAQSLAWGILHILDHPDWARMRAQKAYQIVTKEYNWEHIAARTKEVYMQVISEKQPWEW